MKILRVLSVPVIGMTAALVLAGCSLLSPQQPDTPESPQQTEAPPNVTVEDLDDSSWSGTDSQGYETAFTLHSGGSVAVDFNGNAYDDPADTWALDDSTLTITIYNVEDVGIAIYTGEVDDPAGPIDLDLSFSDVPETRTLTITRG
jgi:hypothetical protein